MLRHGTGCPASICVRNACRHCSNYLGRRVPARQYGLSKWSQLRRSAIRQYALWQRKSFSTDEAVWHLPRKSSKRQKSNVPGDSGSSSTRTIVAQGRVDVCSGTEDENVFGGWPTVIQQAQNNMRKFTNCVVLTRVGNFYELYFEQATEYAPLLNIKLASKPARGTRVPMAGFPFFQLDRYLKTLVQDLGRSVAISEEVRLEQWQKISYGGLDFDRQVKRVITPGTLVDEQFLDPQENNYLLAISRHKNNSLAANDIENDTLENDSVGLAWLDLSSGDFSMQCTRYASLSSAIARIRPKEVLLEDEQQQQHPRLTPLPTDGQVVTLHTCTQKDESQQRLEALIESSELIRDGTDDHETSAAVLLLDYVTSRFPGFTVNMQAPVRRRDSDYMTIDRHTLRGLEILQTMRDGLFKGSLLHVVRRTATESGARLLAQRLTSPSTSLKIINERLDVVQTFVDDETLLERVVLLLQKTYDTFRLLQRFSLGRGDADDLLRLARTVTITRQVGSTLKDLGPIQSTSLKQLTDGFQWSGPERIAARIIEAIDEEGLDLQHRVEEADEAEAASRTRSILDAEQQDADLRKLQKQASAKRYWKDLNGGPLDDVWIMKRTASPNLIELHEHLDSLQGEKCSLSERLRKQLKAESLALKFTPGLGHICHVKGKDTRIDLANIPEARTVSSSKSTKSFYHPTWTELGKQMSDARERIRSEEQVCFRALRDAVIDNLIPLRRNAGILDELDVAISFARLALEHDLRRPALDDSTNIRVYGGRHIMVDAGLAEEGRGFTPNDCILSTVTGGQDESKSEHIHLITGPNMAGKSTYLRANALIVILAQTGSFVPAAHCSLGLVDRIFSRVGSADSLSNDQSTFMVEMLETAQILKDATNRSFVIMDEVGRGTTPEDGVAVSYAVLEALRARGCRSLFATHFHKLADLTKDWKEVGPWCTDVREDANGGSFWFDHKMRRGVNRQSHALKVAQLAGMPADVVKNASRCLELLQQESHGS